MKLDHAKQVTLGIVIIVGAMIWGILCGLAWGWVMWK